MILCTTYNEHWYRTKGIDLDVAIYMGLDAEDVEENGGAKEVLRGLWSMFSSLKDPERQTAVVNLDGTAQVCPILLRLKVSRVSLHCS